MCANIIKNNYTNNKICLNSHFNAPIFDFMAIFDTLSRKM